MSLLNEPLRFDATTLQAVHRPAKVTLVGAGPGDPDLLTVKAARALQSASLVLYDQLVGPEVLALVPASADRVYVGKEAGHHSMPQDAIIDLMLRLAKSGRPVLRLKGGDPYIFGRGGEEAQALAEAGIPFEVVPGISAAQGAAAMAGMPLTHRDHACSLVLTTGHLRGEGDARGADLDWELLARPRQTVVVYMGVGTLPTVCARLVEHGLPADTPAATIERATRPDQRTVVGTLATLPSLARLHGVKPPALIIIGGVVSLHATLSTQAQALAARSAAKG
ncbi:uroporphyrinogen-III C-methyltransferase [Ideonella sp. A 288]|uniref:uroporphyrinogen-III C-methyltransferase n=1 Tax=Ideonella sp. A 288 TaxID=1962181 RepID=UPI000B4B9E35|nr:uroporphyrinogen-III C-methyltransferase [Ideonella sp. A 288]